MKVWLILFNGTKIIEADFIFNDVVDRGCHDGLVSNCTQLKKFVGREMYKQLLTN
jgi:hypothetical protein